MTFKLTTVSKQKLLTTIFLALILISSFFVRWYKINEIPYRFEGDEFSWITTSFLNQYGISSSEKGIWSLHDTNAKNFPVSSKINQISFTIFGKNYLSPRKMIVVLSTISLLIFFLILRNFVSEVPALIVLVLYSFSTYKLITSKIVLPGIPIDFFANSALAFALSISPKIRLNLFIVLLSGIMVTTALFVYNLAYTLPFAILLIIFLSSLKNHLSLKKTLLLLVIFSMPVIASSRLWLKVAREEFTNKGYIFGENSEILTDQSRILKLVSLENIEMNLKVIKGQLFEKLKHETCDMVVCYPSVIINKTVTFLFLLGFIFSIIKIKKYFQLIIGLLICSVPYHIFMGLNLPRVWIITVGFLYLFAAIAIEKIYQLSSKFPPVIRIFSFSFIGAVCFLILKSDWNLYWFFALKNFSSADTEKREIIEIGKKNIGNAGIMPVITKDDSNAGIVNAVFSFYYLAENPDKSNLLKKMNRKDFKIFTESEVTDLGTNSFFTLYYQQPILVENTVLESKNNIFGDPVFSWKLLNKYQYFSLIEII